MIAKLHLRRLSSGHFYVQGVIPNCPVNEADLPQFSDCIAGAEITLVEIESREVEYAGKSDTTIKQEGFP